MVDVFILFAVGFAVALTLPATWRSVGVCLYWLGPVARAERMAARHHAARGAYAARARATEAERVRRDAAGI